MKAMGPIPSGFEAGADGQLLIGGQRADELAGEGTPLFVYDRALMGRQIARFRAAMPDGVALHYAVKANPYEPLLSFLAQFVDGFDVASAGELGTVVQFELPNSIAGPGKSDSDLAAAIDAGATINLESESEAERALAIAVQAEARPKLAVRVNPPFALKGAGMKMGGLASPFGVDHDRAAALIRRLIDADADWRGLHIFTGSQALDADAIVEAQRASVALAAEIAGKAGQPPPEVNLGGGFGIPYFPGEAALDVERIGVALGETLRDAPPILNQAKFAIELGRWLVGEAGIYLTRIVDRKESGGRTFLITDGGLHHMLAASGNFGQLLRRNYPVAIANCFGSDPQEEVNVTGCLCTPLDLLADQVMLPKGQVGDVVAIFCAGAYGLSASPQAFLGQPAAKEWLV
jgi:diaminopimelate decarboxylase